MAQPTIYSFQGSDIFILSRTTVHVKAIHPIPDFIGRGFLAEFYNYEEEIKDKKRRIDNLYSSIREYEDELKELHRNFPTLKQAVTEWMEYQKEQNENN